MGRHVKLETAQQAYKLGYAEATTHGFDLESGKIKTSNAPLRWALLEGSGSIPLQTDLQEWLRRKALIHVEVMWNDHVGDSDYSFVIAQPSDKPNTVNWETDTTQHPEYEDAFEGGLIRGLKHYHLYLLKQARVQLKQKHGDGYDICNLSIEVDFGGLQMVAQYKSVHHSVYTSEAIGFTRAVLPI